MEIYVYQISILIFSLLFLLVGIFSLKGRNVGGQQGDITILLLKLEEIEDRLKERDDRIKELKDEAAFIRAENNSTLSAKRKEIESLKNRIQYLEALSMAKIDPQETRHGIKPIEVLLVTTNKGIQETDEIALNRAGVSYRRIVNATKPLIDDELRRRRQEKRLYKYVILSAHMNETGVIMSDGEILDSYWLNVNLKNVVLVMLNGCRSTKIADDLFGVAEYVISMSEDVPNISAGSFLYAFWNQVVIGMSISEAYEYARDIEPAIAPYVDLLSGG